jgi:hypothetical protein
MAVIIEERSRRKQATVLQVTVKEETKVDLRWYFGEVSLSSGGRVKEGPGC